MSWHVYMLRLRNGTIYIGHTNDLDRRFGEHSTARGSKATKESNPMALIYAEPFPDRVSASLVGAFRAGECPGERPG
jgi:predicted GIY-YIG superfamily endonuclease